LPKAFPSKMSANPSPWTGAIKARNPAWATAQTACSRLDPQPKFFRTTRIDAPRAVGALSGKLGSGAPWLAGSSGWGAPPATYRLSAKSRGPYPTRSTRLR